MSAGIVEAAFQVKGKAISVDHGYALFGALSQELPQLHTEENTWSILPVRGDYERPGRLVLNQRSRIALRLPATELAELMVLSGKVLRLGADEVTLGLVEVSPLKPAATIQSRFVTIKGGDEPDTFDAMLMRRLGEMEAELGQEVTSILPLVGERRVMRISSHTVVGYPVRLEGLEAAASLALQAMGLGGRRHFGAGVFLPAGRG
jgi:CRISPR-associated protein Cas6